MLEKKGIRVISTAKDLANAELAVIPAETLSVLMINHMMLFWMLEEMDQGLLQLDSLTAFLKKKTMICIL
jgi:hypothetical protein